MQKMYRTFVEYVDCFGHRQVTMVGNTIKSLKRSKAKISNSKSEKGWIVEVNKDEVVYTQGYGELSIN